MTEDNEQVEIQEDVTQPNGATVDDSPEAGIESLRRQVEQLNAARLDAEAKAEEYRLGQTAERQAREEAERRAREASTDAHNTRRSATDAQYDSVINALAAAQGELTSAKSSYKDALAEGDFDRAADLSAEMGIIAAKLREFEQGKTALEQRRQSGTEDMPRAAQEDPRESYIRSRTPRTAAWLRRNDRFFTDSNFQQLVSGAHQIAVARGIPVDSDGYFSFIEEQAGLRQAQQPLAAPEPPPAASSAAYTTPRASPTPAAPVANTTPAASRPSSGGRTVTLSAEQREFCRVTGVSEAAYAKQVLALSAEGRIGQGNRN